MIRIYWGKILGRLRKHLGLAYKNIDEMLIYAYLRNESHMERKKVVKRKGSRFVLRVQKKLLKVQAKDRFGKSSFWPFLALFSEIRGGVGNCTRGLSLAKPSSQMEPFSSKFFMQFKNF